MPTHFKVALLISWVCIYKHDLFVPIYILRKRKSIHTPDNAHLFKYPCVSRIFIFFSIDEIKIFFIIIIYDLTAAAYMCQESNLTFVKIMACRLIGVIFYINADLMSIWHILISESVSVYNRGVIGLLSVWVRDCRSAVGYDSSIVLMIGFQSVSCRLSIDPKSGDSIPNLTRNDPDMNPTGFAVSSATLIFGGRQLPDSMKILCFFVGFVSVWSL